MLPLLYRGSVKDLHGPVGVGHHPSLVFRYTDAFSVFDWGRMPDVLSQKGEALAVLAAHWFETLARPETWREFSKTPEALALRRGLASIKGSRPSARFNEIGEQLQN